MEEKRKSFAAIHGSGVIKLDEGKYNIIYANPVYESEENDKNLTVSIDDMKKFKFQLMTMPFYFFGRIQRI